MRKNYFAKLQTQPKLHLDEKYRIDGVISDTSLMDSTVSNLQYKEQQRKKYQYYQAEQTKVFMPGQVPNNEGGDIPSDMYSTNLIKPE